MSDYHYPPPSLQDYEEPVAIDDPEESESPVATGDNGSAPERQITHRKIVVTEIVSPNNFWAQLVDQGVRV